MSEGTSTAVMGAGPDLDFRILGPLRVLVDGREVTIASRRQRALLVLLLMSPGRTVPSERLIDHLWDGASPPQAAVTLRSYISNLRQNLRGAGDESGRWLVTRGSGYCMDVPRETVDAVRLTELATQGREHLRSGRGLEALSAFESAVELWSDDPLAEIADHDAARSTIAHLTESYLGAAEGRFQALLDTGRHLDAIAALDAFATDHPLREEPHALLMHALYRAGRIPEALETYRGYRTHLQDELGIDPSARMDDLATKILSQDPGLAAPHPPAPAPTASPEPGLPSPPATSAPSSVLFVGRQRELTVLESHLDRLTREGTGALVLLGGEPGIGKSSLLDALGRAAVRRGVPVHHGRSPAAGSAPPFWPWSQVLESLASPIDDDFLREALRGPASLVPRLSASVAARSGSVPEVSGDDPQSQRYALYEAVSTFLRNVTADGPVVISLDDIHWADLPSLELVSYLTATLSSRPVLITATYRNLSAEWTEALVSTLATISREDIADEISLDGLSPDEVAMVLEDLVPHLDQAARERLAEVLHDRTGGNPFFVRQLGRLLVDSGAGALDPTALPVPAGVRHVIADRLQELSPATAALLDAASVIGREFDLRTAARAAGLSVDEALDAFDQAAAYGMVEDGGASAERRFVHTLVQEVVRDRLPSGRAARLHADVAAQLENDAASTPEALALHLWAARDIAGRAAIPAFQAAADAAASVFAHEEHELHLRRALSIARTSAPAEAETELTIVLSLFRLVVTARGWGDDDAREMVDRAMELAGAGTYTDASAGLWWSLVFFLLDRDDTTYADVTASLLAAGAHESPTVGEPSRGPAARAAVHLMAIFEALSNEDRDGAADHLLRARRLVEASPDQALAAYDEHLHVMLLLIEGYWAALHNDAAAHRRTSDTAVAVADADGRPFPRAVARVLAACSAAPYLDDTAIVPELARSALEVTGRHGFGWLGTLAECVDGYARALDTGAPAEAVEPLEQLLATVEKGGHHGNAATLLLMLARLYAAAGEPGKARSALLRARSRPGPYAGLVVDVVDRRITELEASAST